MKLFLARGIEDEHYWVVEEIDGVLVESPWRIEHEADGWVLSHADDAAESARVFALGPSETPAAAVHILQARLQGF